MRRNICCNEKLKNIVLVSIGMGLIYSAVFPANAVQNIALAESSDISLTVGYYAAIVNNVGSILTAFVFQFVYNRLGLKLTIALSMFIITGAHWPMIWVTNQYLIYVGEFLSGVGRGFGWIFTPMIVMDNSEKGKSQRNMGYNWTIMSAGVMAGGLCNYFYFVGVTTISVANRQMVYALCAGVTLLASLIAGCGVSEIKGGGGQGGSAKVTYVKCEEGQEEEGQARSVESENDAEGVGGNGLNYSLGDFVTWFKMMGTRLTFWAHFVPLIYTGFIWAYFYKMFPTAIPSISDQRKLIPLSTVIMGGTYLVGTSSSNILSRWFTPAACVALSSCMILVAMILSVLIFPKEAASKIIELGTAETYIRGGPAHLISISALIGLGDGIFSVIHFTAIGRLYGRETSLGYSVNILGYYLIYGLCMFTPTLFDIHSYCYVTMATVVASCLALTVGLKNYL